MKSRYNRFSLIPIATLVLTFAGCGGGDSGGPPPGFAVPVVAVEAAVESVSEQISLVATLTANEQVEIRSEVEGRIAAIHFLEGSAVKQGQLLVELESGKLDAALEQAEANFALAEANLRRSRMLMESRTISRQEHDQTAAAFEANRAAVHLARERLADARIHASFDGRIGAQRVSPGQQINPGSVITTLVDSSVLKAEFHVPERVIGSIKPGQAVRIRTTAYPDEIFEGEVYFISPSVDVDTRTVLIKAMVPNTDGRLKPGMFGNLDLVFRMRDQAVVIPESAVNYRGNTTYVYIVNGEGKADLRPVVLGVRLRGRVEVLQGVDAGERVITEGHQKIGQDVPVQSTPKSEVSGAADTEQA